LKFNFLDSASPVTVSPPFTSDKIEAALNTLLDDQSMPLITEVTVLASTNKSANFTSYNLSFGLQLVMLEK